MILLDFLALNQVFPFYLVLIVAPPIETTNCGGGARRETVVIYV